MELSLPVLFINFKTYAEATGKNAVSLAKKAESVSRKEQASIALVVQAADIRAVGKAVELPVFAQHIDPIKFGGNTGCILPEAIKQAGAVGSVLNHAENKRDNAFLKKAIGRAKELGLTTLLCAETLARAKQIAGFPEKPDFIAVEPPELIGGDVSVSAAEPGLISRSVKAVKGIAPRVAVITGAGIKGRADVERALQLGSKGIFVSSGIVKASDQEKAIIDLVRGF